MAGDVEATGRSRVLEPKPSAGANDSLSRGTTPNRPHEVRLAAPSNVGAKATRRNETTKEAC